MKAKIISIEIMIWLKWIYPNICVEAETLQFDVVYIEHIAYCVFYIYSIFTLINNLLLSKCLFCTTFTEKQYKSILAHHTGIVHDAPGKEDSTEGE